MLSLGFIWVMLNTRSLLKKMIIDITSWIQQALCFKLVLYQQLPLYQQVKTLFQICHWLMFGYTTSFMYNYTCFVVVCRCCCCCCCCRHCFFFFFFFVFFSYFFLLPLFFSFSFFVSPFLMVSEWSKELVIIWLMMVISLLMVNIIII